LIASVPSDEFANWGRGSVAKIEVGNFAGWIDEITVRSLRGAGASNASPSVSLLSPHEGANLAAPASMTLSANAADPDGNIAKVEFFSGSTKIGEAANGSSPYTLTWSGIPAGTYSVTARASDHLGASTISAPVTFTVTQQGGSDSGARVTFINQDSATRGNWRGAYGTEGFNVIGNKTQIPAAIKIATTGKSDFSWGDSIDDTRALQHAAGDRRVAGCWYSTTSFITEVNFTDGKTHRLALYALDWDRQGRAQTVEILDASTGAVLHSQTLTEFEEGKYLLWDIKGAVKIRVTLVNGPNALISGLFFNEGMRESDVSVAPRLSCPSGQLQVGAHGFRLHISGRENQQVILEASTNLMDWSPVGTNTLSASELDLIDPPTQGMASRFYRVRSVSSIP
jgi:hypothetical protein